MNHWKRYVPLTFAVTFAMLASVSVYFFLTGRSDVSHAAGVPSLSVVVAKYPITIGEKLEEADLNVISWPESSAPKDGFHSPRPAVGRIARLGIAENEPVLESKLLPQGEGFSALIPKGMRAVTISLRHSDALAEILSRGVLVDVMTLVQFESSNVVTAEVIVERARVLTVHNQKIQVSGSKAETRDPTRMEVTLLVTPTQAKAAVAAMSQGVIELAVRDDQ